MALPLGILAVLMGEVQLGQHEVAEGNWLLRKTTGMGRGQPEGALRTENLTGDKGDLAELVTTCKATH